MGTPLHGGGEAACFVLELHGNQLEAIFGQQLELPVRRYAACREGRCVPLAWISLPFRIRRSRAADVRALLSVTFMQASPRRTD